MQRVAVRIWSGRRPCRRLRRSAARSLTFGLHRPPARSWFAAGAPHRPVV